MVDALTSLAAFLVAIGLLVAVHEYGHFAVARAFRIKVLRYSIGFGRPLWIRRGQRDDTEYCVSAIPLGGYVKLLDERDCAVTLAERDRAFNRQPVGVRIAVLAAGPLFNLAFAVLAYWAMFLIGVPGMKPVVGEITADSVAARAGLVAGDTIRAVAGHAVSTWEGAIIAMLDTMLAKGEIPLEVSDGQGSSRRVVLPTRGREQALTEPGQLFTELGLRPWASTLPPVLGEVFPGGSAEAAGLRAGDHITAANGLPIETWPEWVEFVRARPDERVMVELEREGRPVRLPLTIAAVDEDGQAIGQIGAAVRPLPEETLTAMRALEHYGPIAALGRAIEKTWAMSALTVRMIARMLSGDVSVKNISGPINIAQYAGVSASIGPSAFLGFLAIVSISLGLLNLLPIPLLDGGQILYSLLELAKGSPLSERAQLIGQQLGILLLLLMMSFAFYNDIERLLR